MSAGRHFKIATTVFGGIVAGTILAPAARAQSGDEIVKKMRDTYAALTSYADTGVVIIDSGFPTLDRHTFATSMCRTPRHFILDFRKQGGDRFVIWGDPDAFHTWWKTTGQQTDYPNPNNTGAISLSGRNASAALKVPTLWYSKVPLGGDFNNYTDVELDGKEVLEGRLCYRLIGRASDKYAATEREVNIRRMTVWIDTESTLIRQVREDWKGVAGRTSRVTTTYQPQANRALDDSKFKFTPPTQ